MPSDPLVYWLFRIMLATRVNLLSVAILLAVLMANAAGLRPELEVSRVDQNDNASHYPMIAGMVHEAERGGNPLDFWCPEWSLGYPVLRTYQPLAHAMAALIYFALGKTVSLMTVFVWVRYLSVVLLPLSFFAAAWLMDLGPLTAAAAALLAPLVSANLLYGLEYESYVWAGWGLFPQSVACHFLLLTLGLAYRAIHKNGLSTLAGAFLGLTLVTHLIYGYIGALSVCLLAMMPDSKVPLQQRVRRILWIALVSAMLAAFQLVPLFLDHSIINHSRLEAAWKWDSYGAGPILQWLFTGQLLDHGRLPALSLLALGGLVAYWLPFRGIRQTAQAHTFALAGAALWILVSFGRPFWGPGLLLLAVSPDMHLHRVIGGAQLFLVMLAAVGLAALWRALARVHFAAALMATALILYPMVTERARYLATGDSNGHANLNAYLAAKSSIDATLTKSAERGGRVYAGLGSTWGPSFKIGYTPFYAFLSRSELPAVAYLYHTMALTADIVPGFDEGKPAHYRLFNIRTFVLPARYTLPPFLTFRERIGPFQIFDTPARGYFDVVEVPASVRITRQNFYDVNDRWMRSGWLEKGQYLRLDLGDDASSTLSGTHLPSLDPGLSLPLAPSGTAPGTVTSEWQNGQVYQATLTVERPGFALFRMTWHPRWKVYVDGKTVDTVMLSPGFLGAPVNAGSHRIVCRYEPGMWKIWLALAGVPAAVSMGLAERRRTKKAILNRQ